MRLNLDTICLNCFNPLYKGGYCANCGCDEEAMKAKDYDDVLAPGTLLRGRYLLGKTLGKGGFGVTYAGLDLINERKIAIKESYISSICGRGDNHRQVVLQDRSQEQVLTDAKQRFLKEISLLKENRDNPAIIQVHDVFEENSTVYYAMEFLNGQDLSKKLKTAEAPFTWEETAKYMEPVFMALISLHRFNIWHRDISPDNIFLCEDGQVRLIDFGSARTGLLTRSFDIDAVKKGYAPIEQYSEKVMQGTWTDVYSLAATVYKCLTGVTPPGAPERSRRDELREPSSYVEGIPAHVEHALMKGLEVYPEYRYQTVAELKCALFPDHQTIPLADRIVADKPEEKTEDKKLNVRIRGLAGFYAGREFPVEGILTLGRREDSCDVVYPPYMPGVSSVHCNIRFDEQKKLCVFRDLNSTYGSRDLGGKQFLKGVDIYLNDGEGFIIGDDNVFAVLF